MNTNRVLLLGVSICVIAFCLYYMKTNEKNHDIGHGYADFFNTEDMPHYSFQSVYVRTNTKINISIFSIKSDISAYKDSFLNNLNLLLMDNNFKKSEIDIDWVGDTYYLYSILKSDGIHCMLFKNGEQNCKLEFVTDPDSIPVDLIALLQNLN